MKLGSPIICESPGKMNCPLPLCLPAKPGSGPPITLLARRWVPGRTWPIAERMGPALLLADHDELAWCCGSIDTYWG